MSDQFAAGSAVTQASCWSPDISNVFISVLILQLKELNIGCRVSGMFGGCLLHADDIILLTLELEVFRRCWTHVMKLRILSLFSSMFINVIVWLLAKCVSFQYHVLVLPSGK